MCDATILLYMNRPYLNLLNHRKYAATRCRPRPWPARFSPPHPPGPPLHDLLPARMQGCEAPGKMHCESGNWGEAGGKAWYRQKRRRQEGREGERGG